MTRPLAIMAILLACACTAPDPVPIRERPWNVRPMANPNFLITWYEVIYVPPGRLAEFTVEPVSLANKALIAHETVHAQRQAARLPIIWHLSYSLSAGFRWQEERAGYAAQLAYLRTHGARVDTEAYRRWFVGLATDPSYSDMVSAEDAGRWFDNEVRASP